MTLITTSGFRLNMAELFYRRYLLVKKRIAEKFFGSPFFRKTVSNYTVNEILLIIRYKPASRQFSSFLEYFESDFSF